MTQLNITYRFISISLALLIFITSVSFTVDMHYCGGQLKSFNLFGKAKSCHSAEAPTMKNCPMHQKMMEQNQNTSVEQKDCCENRTLHFELDQDQKIQKVDLAISQNFQQFLTAYVSIFFFNSIQTEINKPSFVHYKSPLIARDISVLFQSFLI